MMLIEQNFIIVVSVAKTTYMSKGAGFVDPVFGKPKLSWPTEISS